MRSIPASTASLIGAIDEQYTEIRARVGRLQAEVFAAHAALTGQATHQLGTALDERPTGAAA